MSDSVFVSIVNDVAKHVCEVSRSHGFWRTPASEEDNQAQLAQKVALIHSEVSEFLELLRHNAVYIPDKHCLDQSAGAVELADVVIRVFDLAHSLGLDIGGAIEAKVKYNESRPFKHGKAY